MGVRRGARDDGDDGRVNLIARGTRVFRVESRQDDLPYPAGTVEFLADREEEIDPRRASRARGVRRARRAGDRPRARPRELDAMSAYEMAATVEFGLDAKQGLLDLRSETARLKLVARLFRAAIKRLDFVERAQARARSNGKVRFPTWRPGVVRGRTLRAGARKKVGGMWFVTGAMPVLRTLRRSAPCSPPRSSPPPPPARRPPTPRAGSCATSPRPASSTS